MNGRLSLPHSDRKGHYKVVVIGSGYGGGIAASRLARAGQEVCVLERGKEFMPGEFPDTLNEARGAIQVNTKSGTLMGNATGLYDFQIGDDVNVLRGCGLGGTSLINANVVIEADPRVFTNPAWPKGIQADLKDGIQKGYSLAREMLNASPYPTGKDGYKSLKKNETHQLAATALPNGEYKLTDIAVNFKKFPNNKNHVGMTQTPCNNCGDCCSGCNYTSKNTTQMTYLADAYNYGAEIYTEINVKYIDKDGKKWRVHFDASNVGREGFNGGNLFVTADIVILSAGTLGSTEILLRSSKNGLQLSNALGTKFSGNGDTFAFAYNTDHEVNGIGWGTNKREEPAGPCITAIVDTRAKSTNYKDGMTLEEGVIPGAMAGIPFPQALAALSATSGIDTDPGVFTADNVAERTRELTSMVSGPYTGAVKNTKTFLVMSHDSASGKIQLTSNDRLNIVWPGAGKEPIFGKIDETLLKLTKALGGTYIGNPLRSSPFYTAIAGKDLITVHPLGGCPMGDTAQEGVVNHKGQVFAEKTGTAVHEGLYVTDGSIIPTSVGTNPLLTISALSENNMAHLIRQKGWSVDYKLPSSPANRSIRILKPGILFTESMQGHISLNNLSSYNEAERAGIESSVPFKFVVTIESTDLDQMLRSKDHQAAFSGTVEAPALSSKTMTVTRGIFNLFSEDPTAVNTRKMLYQMTLHSQEGKQFFVKGFKTIKDDHQLDDMWKDTTTLYTDIHENDASGRLIGKGILHIRPQDLMTQLTTMRVTNVADNSKRLEYMVKFGRFFAGALYDTHGQIFRGFSYFDPTSNPRKARTLNVNVSPEIHEIITQDKEKIRLIRFKTGNKGPVLLAHGLGVSSKIFTMDTIDTNLLEYLGAYGYDIWLLDYRASIELAASKKQFSGDEIAKYDFPAAVERIKQVTQQDNIQVVAHCFGATTFTMAVLGGYVKDIRSAVISQVSAHVIPPLLTQVKSGIHLPEFLKELRVDSLDTYAKSTDNWLAKLADRAATILQPDRDQDCDNPVCYRINAIYGQLYEHKQLNQATHKYMHEMFGQANVTALSHLALMTRKQQVVDAKGNDTYLPNIKRMNFPITFISGENNKCFLPVSTEKTYDALRKANGNDYYKRYLIPQYGHIDCIFGKNAANDVYPLIRRQLDETPNPRLRSGGPVGTIGGTRNYHTNSFFNTANKAKTAAAPRIINTSGPILSRPLGFFNIQARINAQATASIRSGIQLLTRR